MGVIGAHPSSSSSIGFLVGGGGAAGDEEGDDKWDSRITLAPLMATLLLPILLGAILLFKCVYGHCCARKTSTKEEMYGVEGRMTMLTNSDAAYLTSPSASSANNYVPNSSDNLTPTTTTVNPLLAAASQHQELNKSTNAKKTQQFTNNNNNPDVAVLVTTTNDVNPLTASAELHRNECDLTDTLRRTTGKRQLPDLPELPQHSLGHPPRRSSSVLSHDGTSELYATVGEVPNPYAQLNKTRHSVPNDVCQPSTSRGSGGGGRKNNKATTANGVQKNSLEPNPSSDSETYASSVHPYAKLKRNSAEHPYARVRNASLNNDEETDTDNYDLPQPYAQSRGRPTGGGGVSNVPNSSSSSMMTNNNAATSSSAASGGGTQGPVPPRRIGRQWRRGSQPQTSVDSATHFSGDSQDSSRGYTSISVREPLSNIRSQVAPGRTGDSHYATVSDDSEEMYAAIDDASVDGNYMQIPEGERPNRPSWLDATNVGSPIPERREANSPLPPVPAVPPPLLLEGGAGGGAVAASPIGSPSLAPHPPQTPPVYAQVTKKTKKNKAPVTPTASNASNSSQQNHQQQHPAVEDEPGRGLLVSDNNSSGISTAASSSSGPIPSSTHHHSSHHQQHHRSKSRTLMDNTNLLESNISEHRRWSKADISYSEFEVVRETLVPPAVPPPLVELKKSPVTFSLSAASTSNSERQQHPQAHQQHGHHQQGPVSPRDSVSSRHSIISQNTNELLDEDNYNVIPDKRSNEKTNNHTSSNSGPGGAGEGVRNASRSSGVSGRNRLDSDNYQEIEPISNTYQEIGKQSSSDYYQEIGAANGSSSLVGNDQDDDDDNGSGLYQEIRKASPKEGGGRRGVHLNYEDEEEEEDDDQFYEKVKKPSATKTTIQQDTLTISHPSGRKHGYEKIKRKPKSPSPKAKPKRAGNPKRGGTSDDDDDQEEEGEENEVPGEDEEEDLMYEKVKYPPYERLKESRSDLAVNTSSAAAAADDEEEDDEGEHNYEHIGYSRVKPKNKLVNNKTTTKQENKEPVVVVAASAVLTALVPPPAEDLNQLYAVIDKSKKRGKGSTPSSTTNNNNPQKIYNNNNPSLDNNLSSSSTTSRSPYSTSRFASTTTTTTSINSPTNTTTTRVALSLHSDLDFIDDNNEIEYI